MLFSFLSFPVFLDLCSSSWSMSQFNSKSRICNTNVDVASGSLQSEETTQIFVHVHMFVSLSHPHSSESCLYYCLLISPWKVRTHHHVRWSLFIPARPPASFSQTWLGDWLNVGHFSCLWHSVPPSLPNEYPDPPPALDVSLHVCVCDMREDVHAQTWISSLIIHLRAFLICLQVRRRKHVLRFSLNPTIIFIQSCAAHYLMVHRNSSMPTVEIGFTRHHTHKEETETERRSAIGVNYHQAFIETI